MASTPPMVFGPVKNRGNQLPDPFATVRLAGESNICVNQRRRRSQILSNARQLLGTQGYGGVSLREVAERSDVSIQTVYNLVGNRTNLLAEAVVEHIGAHGSLAFTREGYPNPVMALSDLYWQGAALYPEYTLNATLTYFPPDRPLHDHIHRRGASLLRECFRRMAANGQLRTGDCQPAHSRIAALQSITVLDGLSGYGGVIDLRRELVSGVGMLMMPLVTVRHAAEIEQWLDNFDPASLDEG